MRLAKTSILFSPVFDGLQKTSATNQYNNMYVLLFRKKTCAVCPNLLSVNKCVPNKTHYKTTSTLLQML